MPQEANQYNIDLLSIDNIKKYVLPHYTLINTNVEQIKFKDSEKQRAVYKIDCLDTSYCLKKVYFNDKDLLFVYSAIEWLFRNNIKVPRIISTKDNGRFVLFNNMLFILTPWINGTKCSYDNIEHILYSIKNLAVMHKVTKGFEPIEGSNSRIGLENLHTSFNKHFNQLLVCSNLAFKYDDTFSRLFLHYFDKNTLLSKICVDIASSINFKNLSISLCHSDYVNKNILFDEKNEIWVIDFDKCKMDYCIHDIGYFLRRLLKRNNTKWNTEIAINSLIEYDNVKPLNLDEHKAILIYLAFPQKYWKVSRDYYNNINKCNKSSFNTLIRKSSENVDFQIEFISNLQNYIEKKFNVKLQ